jgi:hypothetical protein
MVEGLGFRVQGASGLSPAIDVYSIASTCCGFRNREKDGGREGRRERGRIKGGGRARARESERKDEREGGRAGGRDGGREGREERRKTTGWHSAASAVGVAQKHSLCASPVNLDVPPLATWIEFIFYFLFFTAPMNLDVPRIATWIECIFIFF